MEEIDISGEKFDFVDCSEGNIFFDAFAEKESFSMKIWGATMMTELGIVEQDMYIASMSELVFEDVAYISVNYGIYANGKGTKFIKNAEGNSTNMQLALGKKENLSDCEEYIIGGILGRYIGWGEITIYCRGKIKLTYDEKSMINATEFCLNAEKYRLQK